MAFVNLSAALDMTDIRNGAFAARVNSTAELYSWTSSLFGSTQITALSGLDDITVDGAGKPLGGTIGALFQTTAGQIDYSITDLAAPLTILVDTANPLSNEKYWERVLSGGTVFSSDVSAAMKLAGDFFTVASGETVNGGGDVFDFAFTTPEAPSLTGDALEVKLGGVLTGGADRFTLASAISISPQIFGDAATHAGTVTGGADTILLNAAFGDQSAVSGDVGTSNGVLNGGNDAITINARGDFAADTVKIAGDAIEAVRQVTGGRDTLLLQSGQPNEFRFIAEIAGDVHTIASSDALVTGGNDTITAKDFFFTALAGDAVSMSAGALTGGNDTITVNDIRGFVICGDVQNFTGGTLTPGADTIKGGDGADTIFGESATPGFPTTANTTVDAGGNDTIDGRGGDDTILGQVGNDTLSGGRGNDLINGGSGTDTVTFATLNTAVYVDLLGIAGTLTASNTAAEAIGQGLDDITLCENVTGSGLRDTLKGDGNNNVLTGGGGNDMLNGRGGNDTLVGGAGKDVMLGGAGNDVFDFNAVSETASTVSDADEIRGFASGDKIDLSTIDADPASAVNSFTLVATLSGAAQIAVSSSGGNTIVSGSTDSDAAAEFVIVLRGSVALTSADFVP